MTRGTGYLITDDMIYFHDEFNGDMYRDGYGADFIQMLDKTTPETFENDLNIWNSNNHNYPDFQTYKESLNKKMVDSDNKYILVTKKTIRIDFNIDYFEHWFSDWIFIKNGSTKDITVITRTTLDGVAGKTIIIKPNETYAFNFGYAIDSDDYYTAKDVIAKNIEREEDEVLLNTAEQVLSDRQDEINQALKR